MCLEAKWQSTKTQKGTANHFTTLVKLNKVQRHSLSIHFFSQVGPVSQVPAALIMYIHPLLFSFSHKALHFHVQSTDRIPQRDIWSSETWQKQLTSACLSSTRGYLVCLNEQFMVRGARMENESRLHHQTSPRNELAVSQYDASVTSNAMFL